MRNEVGPRASCTKFTCPIRSASVDIFSGLEISFIHFLRKMYVEPGRGAKKRDQARQRRGGVTPGETIQVFENFLICSENSNMLTIV